MFDDCTITTLVVGGPSSLSVVLLTAAATLLVTTLVLATVWSDRNLDELGLRVHGDNLWAWIWNYCFAGAAGSSTGSLVRGSGRGIAGYDCIQGALSPPLRLACHVSAVLMLWGILVVLSGSVSSIDPSSTDTTCELSTLVPAAFVSITIYSMAMYVIHHLLPSVSMPGGPRPHKIQRQPKWKEGCIVLPSKLVNGYSCLVAVDSHNATSQKFASFSTDEDNHGNACTMTGEPAGRQTWFRLTSPDAGGTDQSSDTNDGPKGGGGGGPVGFLSSSLSNLLSSRGIGKNSGVVDEVLVQSCARGGRDEDYMLGKSDGNNNNTADASGDYVFVPSRNPNSNDQIFRAQQIRKYLSKPGATAPDLSTRPTTVQEACQKAGHFYSMLQCDDGHWAADYGGPHFLMPGLVTAWYVMGKPTQLLDEDQIALLTHYILAHQQVDGGWGTHIESPSTMFGSTLMYVALRLMGTPSDHPACVKGRSFLQEHGGALYTSSWSKFYLCLLGLMDWRGHNSVREFF
jgi:Squalene-hopene cyclase N-terminal domain